ncbi:MAG: ATPase, T2SS/T4P/T4SS family [Candidatus Sericytochromatia bacterium]|nr:ATPase, T2SS/T4P/T4SS family [Candidatus Sericytochromatia bacterium]
MALVKMKLGEILLNANLVTESQLKKAVDIQKETKESLGMILIKQGYISEASIKDALELQYGLRYVNMRKIKVAPEVLKMVPENLIRQHQIIPIQFANNRLTLAMVDPTNLIAIDDVRFLLKGVAVQPVIITEDEYYSFLESSFKVEVQEMQAATLEDLLNAFGDDEMELIDEDDEEAMGHVNLEGNADEAPVIRLANTILMNALGSARKVSDIHVEPQAGNIVVRFRQDGVLHKQMELPSKILPALVSRFKIMSNLDIAEKRLPQDGRISVKFRGKEIDFRVSSLPSKFGEKICMRILDKTNTGVPLDKLFIFENDYKTVMEMVNRPFGIIFVCGPTGSGKTTTLYSILANRNTPDVNISTAEDPIEYDCPGITQCQAKPDIGYTFARILKAFLRQDPDIMLIGETRDKELAKIAIEAALTGHLVFTSLHTNDAPGAMMRLDEMGVEGFLTAAATIGVIAQRLVRKLCPQCSQDYTPTQETIDFVGLKYDPSQPLVMRKHNPTGCAECVKGYSGRMGVYEIMKMTDQIREVVARGGGSALIRYAAKQSGMIQLKDYALKLAMLGHTDIDEVIRVCFSDEGAAKLCPSCRNEVGDDYIKCPFCSTNLRMVCVKCNSRIEEGWKACALCGTPAPSLGPA